MSTGLLAAVWADDLGRVARSSGSMLWATLWALVLGFVASGAVRAFVSERAIAGRLGRRSALGELRAALYGAASSSCSYAASATTRTLLGRGADVVVATIYLVASTNLVLELGLVLLALIGWQFLAAQFLGGAVMITLIALGGGRFLRGRRVEGELRALRDELGGSAAAPGRSPGSGTARARLAAALRFAHGDAWMLRREILFGFVAAGLLSVYVPQSVWSALFYPGHGIWTALENAAIGPPIAMASFVCSIGNVPLAAALWRGGFGFAGVSSFLFADLISLPVLLSYRRLFGPATTLRLLLLFWPVMTVAGFVVGELANDTGVLRGFHARSVTAATVGLNATTVGDLVAVALLAVAALVTRNVVRDGATTATDPVCGMEVDVALPGATLEHAGATVYFCSPGCRDRFVRGASRGAADGQVAIDPVCGMEVTPGPSTEQRQRDGVTYYFCCSGCAEQFERSGATPTAAEHRSPSHAAGEQNEVQIELLPRRGARRPPA